MKITQVSKTKLADKPIAWEEKYTPDTAYFKAMYDDIVGKGSYFRWEGKDAESGDMHFVVVGPAKMHEPKSMFFAGQHKLPSKYSACGEYFSGMREALNHANDKWGVSIPPDAQLSLSSSDLRGVSKRMDKWREDNSKEDVLRKFDKPISNPEDPRTAAGGGLMSREAMAVTNFKTRQQANTYFDLDDLDRGLPPDWDRHVAAWPDLPAELEFARGKRRMFRERLMRRYGDAGAHPEMHKMWLAYTTEYDEKRDMPFGSHLVSIGPYLGNRFKFASNRFSSFSQAIRIYRSDEVMGAVREKINQYFAMYGVRLEPHDFNLPQRVGDSYLKFCVTLGKSGQERLLDGAATALGLTRRNRGWKGHLQETLERRQREYIAQTQPNVPANATPKEVNEHIAQAWERWSRARDRGENLPPPPGLYPAVFGNNRILRGKQEMSGIIKYPAFRVAAGTPVSGQRSIVVEPSIPGHDLRIIGEGSVVRMASYNNKGGHVYGKANHTVAGFERLEGGRCRISFQNPITLDVKLPGNPDNAWFSVYLLDVVRRVDVINGQRIDWGANRQDLARQLNVDESQIDDMRKAYDTTFYGFNDMQTALDYSELKGRPRGLGRITVERNYTSNDLDQFANCTENMSPRAQAEDVVDDEDEDRVPDETDVPEDVQTGAEEQPAQPVEAPLPPDEEPIAPEEEKVPVSAAPVEKAAPPPPPAPEPTPAPAQPAPKRRPTFFKRPDAGLFGETKRGLISMAEELKAIGKHQEANDISETASKMPQ